MSSIRRILFYIPSLCFLVVLSSLDVSASQVQAVANAGSVSAPLGERVTRIAAFRSIGIQAACYQESSSRYVVGTIEGRRFKSPARASITRALRSRGLSGSNLEQRRRRLMRSARISCAEVGRNQQTQAKAQPGGKQPGGNSSSSRSVSIPNLAQWENHMLSYGRSHCDNLTGSSLSSDAKLAATYYDAQLVFFQIGDYTGDKSWYACADAARAVYRGYAEDSNGAVPGFWNFSHGLAQDYLRNGNEKSKNAVVSLSTNGMFARDSTALSDTESSLQSREVAYSIMTYLNAEDVGEARRDRLEPLVDQALSHMEEWTSGRAPFVRPFMMALTAQALIEYHQRTGDSRVRPAVVKGLDWMWENTWLPDSEAFMYTDRQHASGGQEAVADLNLLIAPAFAWAYHQTGADRFANRADRAFAGGATGAWLSNGKQFNQNYRWSFDYLKWRRAKPLN